jgi:hypothetical protein
VRQGFSLSEVVENLETQVFVPNKLRPSRISSMTQKIFGQQLPELHTVLSEDDEVAGGMGAAGGNRSAGGNKSAGGNGSATTES